MIFRRLLIAGLTGALIGCGNGIDQPGNALTSDSVEPLGGNPGSGDWVAMRSLFTGFSSNSIGTVRFQARDQDGRPFDGLTADEFTVFEDQIELNAADSRTTLERFAQLSGQFDTVLLLDVSASLQSDELSSLRQAVWSALVEPVQSRGLLQGQRLAVYSFDSRVRRIVDFTDDIGLLQRALNSVDRSSSASSDLYGALAQGVDEIESSFGGDVMRTGSVIVITDGRDTANRLNLEDVIKEIEGKLVYAVGVGAAADTTSLGLIGTGGNVVVSDYAGLQGALLTVRSLQERELGSYYELRYASPKRRAAGDRDNSEHTFELRVAENANTGDSSRIASDFNSYDFSDVHAEVRVIGDRVLNVGETAGYVARTDWGTGTSSQYSWTVSGDGCSMSSSDTRSVRVVGLQRGQCQLLAVDTSVSVSASITLTVEQAIVEF